MHNWQRICIMEYGRKERKMHGEGYEQREREKKRMLAEGERARRTHSRVLYREQCTWGEREVVNAPLSDSQSVPDRFVRIYTRIVLVFIVSEVKGKGNGRIFTRELSRPCHLKSGVKEWRDSCNSRAFSSDHFPHRWEYLQQRTFFKPPKTVFLK